MLGVLDEEQIDQLLRSEVVGRIGCYDNGRTYVVPITYVYDGKSVYDHSADGMKLRMMRANPKVCFEVDHMDNLFKWRSVIAWGTFEELYGDQATYAMRLLLNRVKPLMTSETSHPAHGLGSGSTHGADTTGRKAIFYRINLTEKTGRFEKN